MILRKLAVKRFRRFADFSIDLTAGLNVVYGPNEAGKSTLHDALLMGLFAKPGSRSVEVMRNQSWFCRGLPAVGLEFEYEGQDFSLAKDFEEKSMVLTRGRDGEVCKDWPAAESIVQAALGLHSAALFRGTAFIGQGEVEAVASEKELRRSIGDELQKVVTGGGEDVVASSVIRKLDDKLGQMQKGMNALAKEPGEIRAAMDKIAEITAAIDRGMSSLSKLEEAQDTLEADAKILAIMREKLRDGRELRARFEKRNELRKELDGLRLREDGLDEKIDTAKSLRVQLREIEPQVAAHSAVANLDSVMLGRLASLQGAAGSWQQQIESIGQEIVELEENGDKVRVSGGLWILLLGLFMFVAGLVGAIADPFTLTFSLVGIIFVILYTGPRRTARANHAADVRRAHGRLHHAKRSLRVVEEEKQQFLARFSKQSYEELLRDYEALAALTAKGAELAARLEGLLTNQTIEELEVIRREVSRQRRDVEELLQGPALAGADIDPLSYQRLIREVEELEASIKELETETIRNRALLESSPASVVDIHGLEEERSFRQSQLAAAQRRLQVYKLAKAAVEEAKNCVVASARDILEAEIGQYLTLVTGGRYEKVSVDEKTLDFAVYPPERDESTAVDPQAYLSRGAQDQVYLSARLALVKMICDGKKPPLVLDDPFVTFDESRLENTMRLCRSLAQEHQILFFTCDPSYRKWADNFIALPIP